MKISVAIGGPLDGVKIQAGEKWSGRVEKDLSGAYRWDVIADAWVWRQLSTSLKSRMGRPSKSKK